MNKNVFFLVFIITSLLIVLGFAKERTNLEKMNIDDKTAKVVKPRANQRLVLVELFTSEGCSSCPPADRVIKELANEQPIANANIIVLSEHVDYWNRLGWQDPYSSKEFSLRQNNYAQVFRNDSVYTPQMVINGTYELNGSDKEKALELISKSANKPTCQIEVNYQELKRNTLNIDINITDLSILNPTQVNTSNEIILAVAEDNLSSSVIRGENAGRKLLHTSVVRKLTVLGQINVNKNNSSNYKSSVIIDLSDKWQRDNLKIVVFVQNHITREVFGVSQINL